MLTARSFVAGLLVVLVVTSLVVITVDVLDGAATGLILATGLIGLLPRPASPAPGRSRVVSTDAAREEEIWWAADWNEPLKRYQFMNHQEGVHADRAVRPPRAADASRRQIRGRPPETPPTGDADLHRRVGVARSRQRGGSDTRIVERGG